jgi:TPR repeat protein
MRFTPAGWRRSIGCGRCQPKIRVELQGICHRIRNRAVASLPAMGLEAVEKNGDASARLIAAGRALLAQGDERFSLSRLCSEAGVTLADFRASFTSRAELLQQLMEMPKAEAPPADPWLERRLRVFERALSGLEEKAERRDREYRLTIAKLEEKLAALSGTQLRLDVAAAGRTVQSETPDLAVQESAPESPAEAEMPQDEAAKAETAEEGNSLLKGPLLLAPLEPAPVVKVDGEFLETARRAAQAQARILESRRKPPRIPTRMLVTAALAVLLLLACAALTLVYAGYTPPPAGGAVTQRAATMSPLARLTARADNGDVPAQRRLALAYLRGDGVEKDLDAAARWAEVAASGGDPEAQYLFGSLNRSGTGVARDPDAAFAWFTRAASAGHLKAMHMLGIAYAEGRGTSQDESAAAAWFAKAAMQGYVDSAFNLAVLYERGHGVAQNPREALRWYRAAAKAGDRSAAARARLLAQQAGL